MKNESKIAVPQIVLSMGAFRVEAVAELKHASCKLREYDYIMVNSASDLPLVEKKHSNCVVFDPWVKECLISGRLLPPDSTDDMSDDEA